MSDLTLLGAGTVGRDVALWAAQRGLAVLLLSRSSAGAEACRARLADRAATLAPEAQEALRRIQVGAVPDHPSLQSPWVIEAVPESADLKRAAWTHLLVSAPPEATLLSATSSLALDSFLPQHPQADRVATFHPFIPMHRLRVVELAVRPRTPDAVVQGARRLATRLDLRLVEVMDRPGLAASRMGLAQGLEAIRLLESGAADAESLDALMVLGYGHPVGPLELSDRVGLDVRLAIAEALHQTTGNPVFAPPALLRRLVAAGCLGRKHGRGFYTWLPDGGPDGGSDGSAENRARRGPALRDPLDGL